MNEARAEICWNRPANPWAPRRGSFRTSWDGPTTTQKHSWPIRASQPRLLRIRRTSDTLAASGRAVLVQAGGSVHRERPHGRQRSQHRRVARVSTADSACKHTLPYKNYFVDKILTPSLQSDTRGTESITLNRPIVLIGAGGALSGMPPAAYAKAGFRNSGDLRPGFGKSASTGQPVWSAFFMSLAEAADARRRRVRHRRAGFLHRGGSAALPDGTAF